MVSGLVTSPELQSWICLVDARPILIASKSLMSITGRSSPSRGRGWCGVEWCRGWPGSSGASAPSLLDLRLDVVRLAEVELLVLLVDLDALGVVQVARIVVRRETGHVVLVGLGQRLVGGQGQLAVGIDAILALLDLLGVRR